MNKFTQHGFTLIEIVIVIILLSIVATATYIKWPGSTLNLDAQTYQVANDIRYAQSLAMTKGQRYRFVKTSSTSYQIQNSSGNPISMTQGNTTVTLNTNITFATFTNLPNDLVNFDGNGTPYTNTATPGTALATTATIPLTAGGETRTISITPQTGAIGIQ